MLTSRTGHVEFFYFLYQLVVGHGEHQAVQNGILVRTPTSLLFGP